MNGRKAKMIRRAGNAITRDLPKVAYNDTYRPPVYQMINGKAFKIQKGVPSFLTDCKRKAYQVLKKESALW